MRLIDGDALLEEMVGITDGWRKPANDWKWYEDSVKNAPTVGVWISVRDRMPEELPWDAKYVLVAFYVEMEDGRIIIPESPVIGKYDRFDKSWRLIGLVEDMQKRIKVTHWMTLPEQPKAGDA